MRQLFKNELKSAIISIVTLVSILMMVGIFITEAVFHSLNEGTLVLKNMGTLNVFIYTAIDGFGNFGEIFKYLFPAIAVIPYSMSYCDDIESGFIKGISTRISIKNYLIVKITVTFLAGFLVFIAGYAVYFLIAFFISPEPSFRVFQFAQAFRYVYDYSMLLFCIACILYSSLVAGAFSLLGSGIAAITKNRYIGISAPLALYLLSGFISWVVAVPELGLAINSFLPLKAFYITNRSEWVLTYNLLFLIVLSVALIVLSLKKWRISASTTDQ